MATYSRFFETCGTIDWRDKLQLDEQYIYGSARLGLFNRVAYVSKCFNTGGAQPLDDGYTTFVAPSYVGSTLVISTEMSSNDVQPFEKSIIIVSRKTYEFSDHLGNVSATISDRKITIATTAGNAVLSYAPEVLSQEDYFPFGMGMMGRSVTAEGYRYGFNGQEKVDEIGGAGNHKTALFWEMDSRIGRRWNLDPKPQIYISDYAILKNSPVMLSDVLGDSSIVDNLGYMLHYEEEDKDLRVFMQDGDKLTLIGELGKNIDTKLWFDNLLAQNSKEADEIYSPFTFRKFVKQFGKWDYKYASPSNQENALRLHIIGVAFDRKDLEFGSGDLPETHFKLENGCFARAEDLNNMHFGVVGKAMGLFTEFCLLYNAGLAELEKKGSNVPAEWVPQKDGFPAPPYGDNPKDHYWIKQGFKYYDRFFPVLDNDLYNHIPGCE